MNKKTETPTSGEIAISADASFKPLIEEELKTFHLTYPEAKINVSYLPESDAVYKRAP